MKSLSILFLTVIAMVICLPAAPGKYHYLIPYRQDLWGMSDRDGKIVIPCKYASIAYLEPYVFATTTGKQQILRIMDTNGKLADSCVDFISTGDGTYILFNRRQKKSPVIYFRFNELPRGMNAPPPLPANVSWTEYNEPLTAHRLLNNHSKMPIKGDVYAVQYGTTRAAVAANGKCGFADLQTDSVLIPLIYDSFVFIKPDILFAFKGNAMQVMDMDGKIYPFHTPANAIYLDKRNGNYITLEKLKTSLDNYMYSGHKLWSEGGKELISPYRQWDFEGHFNGPRYILLRKPKNELKYGQGVFQMADLNGNIILPSLYEINNPNDSLLWISDIMEGKRRQYLYMPNDNRILLFDSTGDIQISQHNLAVDVKKADIHHYYNDKGNEIFSINDSLLKSYRQNFIVEMTITTSDSERAATGAFRHRYLAVRNAGNDNYTLFDEQYKKINTSYDAIFCNTELKYVNVRRNGKWGLINAQLREVVPPIYDTLIGMWNDYAIGKQNGVKKYINLTNFHVTNIQRFDDFNLSSYKEKYLAARYVPIGRGSYYRKIVAMLFITDADGNPLDSMAINDADAYCYAFTGKGKIVKYPGEGNYSYSGQVFVMDNIHAVARQCPYPARAELCYKKVILLQCMNTQRKPALLSPDNFEIVVPFGKYDFLFTYPEKIPSVDTGGPEIEMVAVKGGTNEWHAQSVDHNPIDMLQGKQPPSDRELVGYYSIDGKKYWDKLPDLRK